MTGHDDRLLAVSDLLVLVALERGFARVVPRSQRGNMQAVERHRGYERVAIQQHAIDKALTDAWVLCPVLAQRNQLAIHVPSWQQLLDSYTRSLMLMSQPHTQQQLAAHLLPLVQAAQQHATA